MTTASLKLVVPSSLHDIPFSRMQKWLDMMTDKVERSDIELTKLALEVFCGVPGDIVLKMDKDDVDDIMNTILTILNQRHVPVTVTFKHNDVEYGLIPHFEKMSLGEFVDLSTYIREPKNHHLALGVMYRPITNKKKVAGIMKYEIEDYEGSSDKLKGVNSYIGIGATFFLTSSIVELQRHSRLYLERLQKEDPKLLAHLQENMDGSTVSTD